MRRSKEIKCGLQNDAIDLGSDILRNIVFHEIAHAVYGTQHDEMSVDVFSISEDAVPKQRRLLKASS